jgi:thiol-disulfide isomerase/thioredoxin
MRLLRLASLAASVALSLHLAAGLAQAQTKDTGQPRTPDAVLAELDSLKPPTIDQKDYNNQEVVQAYRTAARKHAEQRAALAWELYKADPSHAQVASLLPERWNFLMMTDQAADAVTETQRVLKDQKSGPLASVAAFTYAQAIGETKGLDSKEYAKAADDFRAIDPKDERGARLYMEIANNAAYSEQDRSAEALAAYKRVIELYPESRAAKQAKGKVRQYDGIGKPFKLKFTDAISGKTIDIKDLKGKVVVVDFWATWCGPCVADMPHMKELYKEYKGRGVEFVGISLDKDEASGGLARLKDFVAKNEIAWPQYYQGNWWSSEFSTSWGINSIPALFVVDKNGNLYTNQGRGKLEDMLPKLLKQD